MIGLWFGKDFQSCCFEVVGNIHAELRCCEALKYRWFGPVYHHTFVALARDYVCQLVDDQTGSV